MVEYTTDRFWTKKERNVKVSIEQTERSTEGLRDKIIVLMIGFVLTGIMGSAIATILQYFSWKNQWAIQRLDEESKVAKASFDRVSSLIDRRRYRTIRLINALDEGLPQDEIDLRFEEYKLIIKEWNDSLNANLALISIYFSDELRYEFEEHISAIFGDLSCTAENGMRRQKNRRLDDERKSTTYADAKRSDEGFQAIIYNFNIELLENLKARKFHFNSNNINLFSNS